MAVKTAKRLPETRSLYEILPKGTVGGKEFARIVDLLLFHAARRAGKKVSIFSDASGDYHGLDSFEGDVFRKQGTTGYQYKFFPSPLSDKHRAEIKKSLERAAQNQKELKLTRWILVTPQDLTESASRKGGGDMTWLEGLRKELGLKFEVEHWGHRKLQGLFLETPALCLYYYPELVQEGVIRRKTVQDTWASYVTNFRELHHRIEFVGMSVYKPEATGGVPMEHIYIPLTVVSDAARAGDSSAPRLNPLSLLLSGGRHVVLGDPGSGKSTLLRFLALAGISKELQEKYGAEPDKQLPVLVILRQYADELKGRRNLSLLDYIQETVQADFTLNSADLTFFEYYLESGQALILFDGLDELPNPEFKEIVRDRIRSLLTTYPGNTAIVTSRIVGYENPFRFDDREFRHYSLSPLQLPEIEQFVNDWYQVRIENPKERKGNVDDLVRILRDETHTAIRELAQNPLLLTIVALVHRIDAVLPDERVVLYQKCTETLLNTWHTWKYRGTAPQKRGKVERRNRQRMEAIAYWMHIQARGTEAGQRAIVPATDLLNFLSDYINKHERVREEDDDPRDQAQDFLDFVKKLAGLLIEVGDARYSFVHLTFQEYLTAAYIVTQSEKGGVEAIWSIIGEHQSDPAWHEVIRLLVAALKANEAQEFLVKQMLKGVATNPEACSARLLGGFLLDGIESAEGRAEEIGYCLLRAAVSAKEADQLRPIVGTLRACNLRGDNAHADLQSSFQRLWQATTDNDHRIVLVLTLIASGWPFEEITNLTAGFPLEDLQAGWPMRLFMNPDEDYNDVAGKPRVPDWESFVAAMQWVALTSSNLIASVSPAVALSSGFGAAAQMAFRVSVSTLASDFSYGPFSYLLWHSCLVGAAAFDMTIQLGGLLAPALARALDWDRALARARDQALDWDRDRDRARDPALDRALALDRAWAWALDWDRDRARARDMYQGHATGFWNETSNAPLFQRSFIELICSCFDLRPRAHWEVALQTAFIPSVPGRMVLLDQKTWRRVEKTFEKGDFSKGEVYAAAWLLLLDSWLWINETYRNPDDSRFLHLAELTSAIDQPPLRLAHCIRDLAYGDGSRVSELTAMVKNDDPAYRRMFEECLWIPTPEEQQREKASKEKRSRRSN